MTDATTAPITTSQIHDPLWCAPPAPEGVADEDVELKADDVPEADSEAVPPDEEVVFDPAPAAAAGAVELQHSV